MSAPLPPDAPPGTAADRDDALEAALRAGRGLVDAPSHLLARADAIWRPRAAPAGRAGGLRRWVAALRQAAAPALALGLRGAATGPKQLLFGIEGVDIDLRLLPGGEPGQTRLHGQVFAEGEQGLVWIAGDDGVVSVEIDAFGEFRAGPLEPGRYRLGIERDDWVVELPPLSLPAGQVDAGPGGGADTAG